MKRSAPLKRTAIRRKEPTADRPEHPSARQSTAKTCAHCGGPFVPARPLQAVCGPVCARRKVQTERQAKEKAEREHNRSRRLALKTIPDLIADAQEAFNAFIRARDKEKGCFVCGRPFDPDTPGRAMHAGHVRSRGAAGHLRFHEDNCLGECEGCNDPKWGAKPHQIKAGAIARIGAQRFAELENDNAPHKWTREELLWIKSHYRAKARELKARAAA